MYGLHSLVEVSLTFGDDLEGTQVQVADEEEHELLLLKPSSLRFPASRASKHDLSNPRGQEANLLVQTLVWFC
ncbi:hypothetical protein Taro_036284 [Colocasia esculenta]|uniref:Uncharacterized protein n=1 Tax=Colocasia esculenta TaxID=4460 RepID=A0A843WCX2_COLES|nr:hypothetical protein [Colocasia esculenta]